MKRSKKKYKKPLKPWAKGRMEKEREIIKNYGLKKKKEIWSAETLLRKFRRMARDSAARKDKKTEIVLIEKLVNLGMLTPGAGLDDALSLTLENLLDRRLQTVILKKGIANTQKQARQYIVHGKIAVNGRKIVYPSYLVTKNEEDKIQVNK